MAAAYCPISSSAGSYTVFRFPLPSTEVDKLSTQILETLHFYF